jgi:pimeloyl-ACP methyl ester carboxylesterase
MTGVDRVKRFRSPDGTEIAAWTQGMGPPVVLVHGTGADHNRFAGVVPALAERFTVYSLDRRGRGASGDGDAYEMEREFEDIAAVVDGLREPANLLGHSYGGAAALESARIAANLRRLILYEPPLPVGIEIYPPGAPDRLQAMLDAGDREGVAVTFLREIVRMRDEEIELMRSLPTWPARVAAAHTIPREMRIADDYAYDVAERFRDVDVPTLLLAGSESAPFLRRPIEILAETLPNAEVAVLDGQGHVAMDSAPELFLRHVTDFLERE